MRPIQTRILAVTAAVLAATAAQAEQQRVIVTIENLAPSQGTFQTPHWVGFHDGIFDIYDGGTPANNDPILNDPLNSVERLAEDGNTAPLSENFATLVPGGIDSTIPGPNGPLAPGEVTSQSFVLDSLDPSQRYFSYASMVIPSNDFWYANGNPQAHPIFDDQGNFVAANFFVTQENILDAGTEFNDELPENTAFFGQAAPNTGVDENGVILDFRDDAGVPQLGFLPIDSGGILANPRFAMGDFAVQGYPVVKISFAAAPAIIDNRTFRAELSGDQEVPAVNTRASGSAVYRLRDEGTRLRFNHEISRLRPREIVMAHLHLGSEGENGPVVAFLFNDENRSQRLRRDGRGSSLRGRIETGDLVGPLQGQPLDRLIAEIEAGNVYINIHTVDNPSGELRGQL